MRLLSLLFALPLGLAAETLTYTIAPSSGGQFVLEVEKTRLWAGRKHVFFYDRYQGRLDYDQQRPEDSRVSFAVDSRSVRCTDEWVKPSQIKEIEKAALDTMGASQYPEIRFASTRILTKSPEQFEVVGNLTIRNVTKPVTLLTTTKPSGERQLRIEGSGRVDLGDFSLKPPSGAFSLVIGTRNEMTVRFNLLAAR